MRSFLRPHALALAAALGAVAALPAHAAEYAIDPAHTFVTFEIGHFGTTTNRGRFDKKQGSVQFDRAAKTGKVDITFDATSVNTGTPMFDKHLQSEELFHTAKFPSIRFVSDQFVFTGDKVSAVQGQLTLLGKTQPVTFKALQFNCYDSPMLKREVCGGDFEASIDRTAFGLDYGVQWGFQKNVRLLVQVEAVKQ